MTTTYYSLNQLRLRGTYLMIAYSMAKLLHTLHHSWDSHVMRDQFWLAG
jgi:hypothetical protein